jgi:CRP-like cAMP-binding protein
LLQHIQLQAHNSAGRRVCHHLLGLLHAHGTPTPLGSRINISFTQQEMGNICGLSRVSVSHIFSRLERQGVIARHQRHVVICRPDLLALEAQGIGSGLP